MASLFQTASGAWHWPSIILVVSWLVTGGFMAASLVVNRNDRMAAFHKEQANATEITETKSQLTAAQRDAATARKLAEELEVKQGPRTINAQQQSQLIEILKDARKFPIRVVVFSTRQESIKFGSRIRELLNATGFSDPSHPNAEPIVGPSLGTANNESIALAYPRREDIDPAQPIQRAFATIGVPMATVLDGASVLTTGQVAVIVADK